MLLYQELLIHHVLVSAEKIINGINEIETNPLIKDNQINWASIKIDNISNIKHEDSQDRYLTSSTISNFILFKICCLQ